MAQRTTSTPTQRANVRPGWDALLLILLTVALVRIDSLAEAAVLPTLRQDVLSHPLLGGLLPAAGIAAMGERSPWPGEPVVENGPYTVPSAPWRPTVPGVAPWALFQW